MHLHGLDLNLLVLLDALLETRSVKLAARRVALSPSAASHALARLRELLDDPVLVRAGRQLVPSARALSLRGELRQLLEGVERLLSPAQVEPARLQRTFTLVANDYAEVIVAPTLSRELASVAPAVNLHSRFAGVDPVESLRSGDADLFIGVMRASSELVSEVLFEDELVCVLRHGHPALRRPFTLQRFVALDHVLLSPRGEPRGVVDRVLATHGLARRIARTCTTFLPALHMVAGSDYVVTMPARIAASFVPPLGLTLRRPPLPLPTFTVAQAWHRRVDADPAHRWLRERVAEWMRASTPPPGSGPRGRRPGAVP